ncbi:MAG: PPOX class F420-dependent oxidoreductase [Acidimicrobiales bacterium]|nr:PPOX class F420-dependent oxidoreductase [Acidimicrobiales bacterium]HRW38934.1 PPOX class F420-dependent oxidoreductase [Aquihabitans sp.]
MATSLSSADALDWAFARPRTAKLAVVLASGAPLVAPVWVARDGDDLLFNTGADTAKGRALRHEPRVSLCFDDEAPPFSFVVVAGTATISEDLAEVRRWAAVIAGRYMGADQAEAYGARNGVPGELLVRVAPTKVTGQLRVAD